MNTEGKHMTQPTNRELTQQALRNEQDAFEKVFKSPPDSTRFEGSYTTTRDNPLTTWKHRDRWEGWKARAELGAQSAAAIPKQPSDADLHKCWIEKQDGSIDGIASMRLALSKYGNSQQNTAQQPEDEPVAYVPNDALAMLAPPRLVLKNVPLLTYAAEGHTAVYTRPQPTAWQELTAEQAHQLLLNMATHIEGFGDETTSEHDLSLECVRFICDEMAKPKEKST